MELRETGKPGAAAVLLWPDDGLDAAVFASVVRSLEKSCRVLVPVFAPEEPPDARVAAVESALLAGYDGRIWGAYGLRGGGSALLSLLAEGKVRVRTCVVEGAVEVPAQGLREFSGTGKAARIRARENRGRHCTRRFRRCARSRCESSRRGRMSHPSGRIL